MIVKSLSRKNPTFTQLANYIISDADEQYIYSRNLYVNPENLKDVVKEFGENHRHLKRQKNSNSLYHEIISLTKSDIDINQQKEILLSVVDEYVKVRANKCLVYGAVHEAHNNIHFHLMISSNEIEKEKNHYLSRKEFNDIKKGLESFVLEKYPELKQEIVINKEKKSRSISKNEYEYTKRTGKKSQKQIVYDKLIDVFRESETKQDFFDNLFDANLSIKVRGKTISFINLETGKAHRLKTLDLEKEFNQLSEKFDKEPVKKQKSDEPTKEKNSTQTEDENRKEKETEPLNRDKEQEKSDFRKSYEAPGETKPQDSTQEKDCRRAKQEDEKGREPRGSNRDKSRGKEQEKPDFRKFYREPKKSKSQGSRKQYNRRTKLRYDENRANEKQTTEEIEKRRKKEFIRKIRQDKKNKNYSKNHERGHEKDF